MAQWNRFGFNPTLIFHKSHTFRTQTSGNQLRKNQPANAQTLLLFSRGAVRRLMPRLRSLGLNLFAILNKILIDAAREPLKVFIYAPSTAANNWLLFSTTATTAAAARSIRLFSFSLNQFPARVLVYDDDNKLSFIRQTSFRVWNCVWWTKWDEKHTRPLAVDQM